MYIYTTFCPSMALLAALCCAELAILPSPYSSQGTERVIPHDSHRSSQSPISAVHPSPVTRTYLMSCTEWLASLPRFAEIAYI
ncbi:hypothetical protein DFP73DRAFT_538274 [Morchella snyderi]|nr:hypothetical protein DFP73DRAFT_538274 [Morchella snyderi]